MRIAQIAPLIESVPPTHYGGTERIVAYLTDELVRQGHQVTLFASADSRTAAELVPCTERALRLNPAVREPLPHYMVMLERVWRRAREFDVLHFHIDYLHFPLFRELAGAHSYDLPRPPRPPGPAGGPSRVSRVPAGVDLRASAAAVPGLALAGTVPHGLPRNLHPFSPGARDGYLAFLGRICPEKQPDQAIEIARRAGIPLKIAAKVDRVDQAYFDEVIRPLLKDPLVEYVGEIGEHDKGAFLGGARALLFPIAWPEPFGLVMIEAMACGTPVIAYRCGSVPEVLEDGVTGFVVEDVAGALAALGRAGPARPRPDPRPVRAPLHGRADGQGLCRVICFAQLGPRAAAGGLPSGLRQPAAAHRGRR